VVRPSTLRETYPLLKGTTVCYGKDTKRGAIETQSMRAGQPAVSVDARLRLSEHSAFHDREPIFYRVLGSYFELGICA
jgi:hypothetical protein